MGARAAHWRLALPGGCAVDMKPGGLGKKKARCPPKARPGVAMRGPPREKRPLALFSLAPAEPFEFASGPIHCLLDRFALLGALRDHLRQCRLRVDLVRDLCRR